ncbi:hypothetical protein A2U01_0065632, partial [Trifolium medium]|nr:hypothetical protein [Trifolium medium]
SDGSFNRDGYCQEIYQYDPSISDSGSSSDDSSDVGSPDIYDITPISSFTGNEIVPYHPSANSCLEEEMDCWSSYTTEEDVRHYRDNNEMYDGED